MTPPPREAAHPNTERVHRGAHRLDLVTEVDLKPLEAGLSETANFIEQMAIDMGRLLASVFPRLRGRSEELRSPKLIERMHAGAGILLDEHGLELFDIASQWTSDTLRGWAAIAVGSTHLELDEQLRLALRFADDHHFGVREWAWLGVHGLDSRGAWQGNRLARRSRRCRVSACPAVRVRVHPPIGVWSRHIPSLKADPSPGRALLDPLRTDPAKYVTNSVANWLNDASKTCPEWVRMVCTEWIDECGPAVEPLCRRRAAHDQVTRPRRVRFLISTE